MASTSLVAINRTLSSIVAIVGVLLILPIDSLKGQRASRWAARLPLLAAARIVALPSRPRRSAVFVRHREPRIRLLVRLFSYSRARVNAWSRVGCHHECFEVDFV